MNIAIISPEYPPFTNWGGVATYNENLAKMLARAGHSVHVLTPAYGALVYELAPEQNITIHPVHYTFGSKFFNALYYRFPCGPARYALRMLFPLTFLSVEWNIFVFFEYRQVRKETTFDVIHSPDYHFPALLIRFLERSVPFVVDVQGSQWMFDRFEKHSVDRTVKGAIERWYVRHVAASVVACSRGIRDAMERALPEMRGRMHAIPNMIDTLLYRSQSPVNIKNIVYWGRLEYRKGTDVLLRAFIRLAKSHSDIRLFLIGKDGGYFPFRGHKVSFETLLKELKVPRKVRSRIIWYPHIDNRKFLVDLLGKVKGIAVFPSRFEPFGYVTLEAMALGYVTVASDSIGGREIISDGVNGFLAHATESSIEEHISGVFRLSPVAIRRLSRQATRAAQRTYDLPVIAKTYEQLYKDMTRFKKGKPQK